jgi:hypothetical protein
MTTPSVIQAKPIFAEARIFAIAGALKALQYLAIFSSALLSRNSCGDENIPENKLAINESRQVFPRIHFTDTVKFRAIAEAAPNQQQAFFY